MTISIIVSAQLLKTSDWGSLKGDSDCAGFVTNSSIAFHPIKWCVQGYNLYSLMSLQLSTSNQ